MILILSARDDLHAAAAAANLQRRGAEHRWVDPGDAPAKMSLTMRWQGGRARRTLRTRDALVELDEVRAAWFRRPSAPTLDASLRDPFMRGYAMQETAQVLSDLWHSMDCAWVPGTPSSIDRADYKFTQLCAAARVGLATPDTLITSDPEEFHDFREAHPEGMISKLPSPVLNHFPERSVGRLTQMVTARDAGHASSVRHAPVTFQPYVPKRSELRVTVFGERAIAVEIDSQANLHTRLDWRRYDIKHTPHRLHRLPDSVERGCVALVRDLGLRYGAIDLVLTPEGEYVFLEINPNGQFLWLEEAAGVPLTEALCDLLVELDRDPPRPEERS